LLAKKDEVKQKVEEVKEKAPTEDEILKYKDSIKSMIESKFKTKID
jgi:hypothetical protein